MRATQDGFPVRKAARILFWLVLVLTYGFGSFAALKSDYSFDTVTEQKTLRMNLAAVSGLLHGDHRPYDALVDYHDRYYGIGFHAPAYCVQKLLYKPVARWMKVSEGDALLLVKQWVSFSLFFVSTFLIFSLMRRFTGDDDFARLAALGHLLWPYLLGQSLVNVKDAPFLCGWLLCTWLSLRLLDALAQGRPAGRGLMILLALGTGWLISVRVAGILIFVQYALLLLRARKLSASPRGFVALLRAVHGLLFLFVTAGFVFLSYPMLWSNPLRVVEAMFYMSHHPIGYFGYTTLTYGVPMPAEKLPAIYIPAWLSVKLPLAIILGCLALPVTLARLGGRDETARSLLLGLLGTVILIPLLMVAFRVTLYNELRQLMFLMPLYFLLGLVSLYCISARLARGLAFVAVCVFVIDNFMAFPYQYVWFNEIARRFQVERYFETDYWGSSGIPLVSRLVGSYRSRPTACLYVDADLFYRRFIPDGLSECIKFTGDIQSSSLRPYLMADYTRRGVPALSQGCTVVDREGIRLFLGREISLARVIRCD